MFCAPATVAHLPGALSNEAVFKLSTVVASAYTSVVAGHAVVVVSRANRGTAPSQAIPTPATLSGPLHAPSRNKRVAAGC